MRIPFCKMSGCGNDFIVIDDRGGTFKHLKTESFITAVCARKTAIGADGIIFIKQSDLADIGWDFFNADGSRAAMCGNGARCAARFAEVSGIARAEVTIETDAGLVRACMKGSLVNLKLAPPEGLELNGRLVIGGRDMSVHRLVVGVPHAVVFVDDVERVPVAEWGRAVRFEPCFQPQGTNVNFVSQAGTNMLHIRTYERGVEDETLACGTGAVAAALIAIALGMVSSPVRLVTHGGDMLSVETPQSQPPFVDVLLEGEARVVYMGELWDEAYGCEG
ncbi:MAG: diaminopimelate epimerase [Deltaproteobacteria bacterium]|nr:diaminopimelate epimerase [Deltaproteobacteria bacterium]